MNEEKKPRLRTVIRFIGVRSAVAALLVFLLTIAATCAGCYRLYRAIKEDIQLQGKVNAVEAAKAFDRYLLVRKSTVILSAYVVDEMMRQGRPNSEILEYLSAQSLSIKKSIDKDYTGLYGWVNGEYLDGDGWVPDADYVPVERPWYLETIADDSDITFVRPYLDEQTKTVLTTVAKKLSDGKSVIAMDITLSRIQEITQEIAEHTHGSYGIVLDDKGQVIAHSDPKELGKNYLEEEGTLGAVLADRLFHSGSNQFELNYNGERYMVLAETIEGDWLSVSLINTREFYQPLLIILMLLALLTVMEAIVFVVVLYNQSAKNLAVATMQEAQDANRAKSRFLSRMSHEIRTPINAIIGLDSIALRDDSIPPQTRDELNKIGTSARHLLSIVNDILDMSRIESGRMELKEEVFSFQEFLDQISIIVNGQCEDKGLSFVLEKKTPLEEYYRGDSLKLKQVLINILGNSVKFTDPPGEITFTVGQTQRKDGRAFLCFRMKDTGIGMDKEFLPKLFEAFSQEDTDNTSRYGGSGLGMAITKSFIEMMGGEIRVESEKGVGSTFLVNVTLGLVSARDIPVAQAEVIEEEGSGLEGLNLLIAEDQELNAEILTDLIELEGMTSEWARNGQQALEMFGNSEPCHFDAILMDMRMPVLDGLGATRQIRALARPDAASVPIIALSANAFEEDVKQCLDAGMNAHLSKPVDIGLLKKCLRDLVHSS